MTLRLVHFPPDPARYKHSDTWSIQDTETGAYIQTKGVTPRRMAWRNPRTAQEALDALQPPQDPPPRQEPPTGASLAERKRAWVAANPGAPVEEALASFPEVRSSLGWFEIDR